MKQLQAKKRNHPLLNDPFLKLVLFGFIVIFSFFFWFNV